MTDLLAGVRVIELAPLVTGAAVGMTLVDLGADVIKVEPPGGDLLRHVFGRLAPGFSPAFVQLNRGKRSVVADLGSPDDLGFVRSLIAGADVLLAGYGPGSLAHWGLDHEALVEPGLVYCQLTGFGAQTPYRDQPAHGLTMAAVAGGAHPEGVGGAGSSRDGAAAVAMAHAAVEHILAALVRRGRTGAGAYLDISGTDAVLASDVMRTVYSLNAHRDGVDADAAQGVLRDERYAVHRTSDEQFVAFAGVEPRQWERFRAATGVSVPADLPALFGSRPQADWLEFGAEHRLALAPVYRDPAQAHAHDPALAHRRTCYDSRSPGYGDFTYLAPPGRVDGGGFDHPGPAPAAGAHTAALRAECAAAAEADRRPRLGDTP